MPSGEKSGDPWFAVALTAVGSAYYHLQPDDARLLWDRLPMIVAILLLYRGEGTGWLVAGLALYATAKLLEAADHPVFAAGQVVIGHTLKHLAAAAGVFCIALRRRAGG